MVLNSLHCAEVPLRNCSLTHTILVSGRFVTAVFPSEDDDVITSPYNSVLAMRQLAEHADCVLPVENQVRETQATCYGF